MKKILIVDDEKLILYSLAAALHREGMDIRTAGTGSEALQEIRKDFCDLCFLDVHLPDCNGLDIMKAVRTVSPDTKIIIMTGSEVDEGMMSSILGSSALFLPKPFDLDHVINAVDGILSGRSGTVH